MGISGRRLETRLEALAAIEPAFAAALAPRRPARAARSASAAMSPCCARSSASRSRSPRPMRSGTSSRPRPAAPPIRPTWPRPATRRLRAAGLSRQKMAYARSLAEEVLSGRLDFDRAARGRRGGDRRISPRSRASAAGRAEIYLLFAEGRPDIWPAGDLAVQIELGRDPRAWRNGRREKAIRELAEAWRPHRGAAAVFAWHHRRAGAPAV